MTVNRKVRAIGDRFDPSNPPTVYCVHESHTPRDLTSAHRFGNVQFLLNKNESPSLQPGPMIARMAERLAAGNYDPQRDYVFWMGGDAYAMLLLGILIERHYSNGKRVKYLRWDRNLNAHIKGEPVGYYVEGEFYNG